MSVLADASDLTLNETAVMSAEAPASITLYNSLAWPTVQWVRVGAYEQNATVKSCLVR